jgi:hypothetical protein
MKNVIILLITLCIALGSNAQTETPMIKVQLLNNHVFPSLNGFGSSFINTSLQANIGFGSTAKLKIPGLIIDDNEILSFEGKVLFMNVNVKYQQRFTPWLSMYFSFALAGRLGTDISTILVDGVNTMNGGSIGWLIRIKQTQKLNLSGTINVKNLTGNFINLTQYIEDIIEDNPNPGIFQKTPAMNMGIGVFGAYAFNSKYGMQFSAGLAYGESFERKKNKSYFSAGILGDVDFMPKNNVPVGFALGYTLSSAPEIIMNNSGTTNIILGKIAYTGANDYELGLQFNYYNLKLESIGEKPFITKIALVLKFYF